MMVMVMFLSLLLHLSEMMIDNKRKKGKERKMEKE
jgi:hypothetical protein